MIQDIVLITTLLLMAGVVGVFVFVALNASKDAAEYAVVQTKAYSIRSKFFWVLLVFGVLITFVTTQDLPFAATRGDVADADVTIGVNGRQWFWELSANEVTAGDTVVFNVTASDVNHGLGVYNPNMIMIAQSQAMPGYTNSLKITFDEPGTYKLLCMEYCGLAHHAMVSELIVKASQGGTP